MPASGPSYFFVVWLLGWTGASLIVNGFVGWALFWQARAVTFPTTDGVVTRSRVTAETDADGDVSYRPDIAYEYEVNGRLYRGTRYSYFEMGADTRAWHAVAAELPIGASVRVTYDPRDPAESLLRPGLTGFHLTLIWFVTPFNAIAVGGWVLYARGRWAGFDPADPRRVARLDTGWLVRLPDIGRTGWFLIALAVFTVLGTFVWGFGFGGDPPVPLAGWLYIGAWALAARIATRHAPPWLEVDEALCVVRFAAGSEVTAVPFEAIRDAVVVRQPFSNGTAGFQYHCELVRSDGAPVRLTTYKDGADAAALVAWLRERTGLSGRCPRTGELAPAMP